MMNDSVCEELGRVFGKSPKYEYHMENYLRDFNAEINRGKSFHTNS
jgi:hypothetical protein